jgi:hypothetical protein
MMAVEDRVRRIDDNMTYFRYRVALCCIADILDLIEVVMELVRLSDDLLSTGCPVVFIV